MLLRIGTKVEIWLFPGTFCPSSGTFSLSTLLWLPPSLKPTSFFPFFYKLPSDICYSVWVGISSVCKHSHVKVSRQKKGGARKSQHQPVLLKEVSEVRGAQRGAKRKGCWDMGAGLPRTCQDTNPGEGWHMEMKNTSNYWQNDPTYWSH